MKSDIDIKDDIYSVVENSLLKGEVSGGLSKVGRDSDSSAEDIVISVLANERSELQEAVVNVNIYVADLKKGTEFVIDDTRCRVLCRMSEDLLKRHVGEDFMFTLQSQRVFPVEGRNEHLINNRLLYRTYNSDY